MKLCIYSSQSMEPIACVEAGFGVKEIDDLYRRSDVIVVNLPPLVGEGMAQFVLTLRAMFFGRGASSDARGFFLQADQETTQFLHKRIIEAGSDAMVEQATLSLQRAVFEGMTRAMPQQGEPRLVGGGVVV